MTKDEFILAYKIGYIDRHKDKDYDPMNSWNDGYISINYEVAENIAIDIERIISNPYNLKNREYESIKKAVISALKEQKLL